MNQDEKYSIVKLLDAEKRFFGLTLDEFIPIILTLGICFFFGNLIIGLLLATLEWLAIRYCKKGQSSSWLFNLMYWYLPDFLFRNTIYLKTPPSHYRHWIR